jgi:hypothetical protein
MVEDNPLDLETINKRQADYEKLMQTMVKRPTWYSYKTTNDVEDIFCYTKPGDKLPNWRNASPEIC